MPLAYRAASPNVQRRSPRPVTWRLRRRKSFAGHDFNQGARLVGHVSRQSATQAVDALYPGHITARQKVSWLLSTKGEPISRALQGRAGLLSSSQPVRAA